MCKRGNRRSRRVCNYRTRVWVNQYNNIEKNYGTVMIVAQKVDECERNNQHFTQESNDSVPAIAFQVVNVQQDKQYSTRGQVSVQESEEVAMTSSTSVVRYLVIGVVIGAICNGIYSFIKHNK